MGYHVYKDRRTPVKGEKLKAVVEAKNKEDKFAATIMKDDCLVGHLPKEKTERFAKSILQKVFSFFYEPVTQSLVPWKLLGKPSIKEMEKK